MAVVVAVLALVGGASTPASGAGSIATTTTTSVAPDLARVTEGNRW